MSKNSPKQNYQAVKEWLAFMKFKPKKRPINNHEFPMEYIVKIRK